MDLTKQRSLRDIVVDFPAAARVFETLGIDYCCGGAQTLDAACREARLAPEEVMQSLEAADRAGRAARNDPDWSAAPLADLAAHIQRTHHKYTREELARLGPLFDEVCAVHGRNHPELEGLRATFAGLAQELTTHLKKEEMALFPYIVRMEESAIENAPLLPPPFGTVRNPVAMMMHEHDSAGDALREMRRASAGYAAPPDACISFQTLYRALAALEADLHQHIHLENNILFPRAVEMERAQLQRVA